MTIEKLKAYINAKNKITRLKSSIPKLRAQIDKMEQEAPKTTDTVAHGRRGKKPLKVSVITGFPDKEYQELKTELLTQCLELSRMLEKMEQLASLVEAFVDGIENDEISEIIELKYMGDHERTWQDVARIMTADPRYGIYTKDSVRQMCKRYLKEHE